MVDLPTPPNQVADSMMLEDPVWMIFKEIEGMELVEAPEKIIQEYREDVSSLYDGTRTRLELLKYYKNHVTLDKFDKYFYKLAKNNEDYDKGEAAGNSEQDAGERPEIANGEGRDQNSVVIDESSKGSNQNDENKAENAPEVARPVGNGEINQRAAEENINRPAGIQEEIPPISIEQQLKNAEADLKTKQATYESLYNRYLSLKNKAEKDESYGMAGQLDLSGNVAGADNLFTKDLSDFNKDIRSLISNAKMMADRAGEEANRAAKEVERLKDEIYQTVYFENLLISL